MSTYRVRFAPQRDYHPGQKEKTTSSSPVKSKLPTGHTRSRGGCRCCRQRRVKCDETFPVCLRCQRRGLVCQPVLPVSQWQPEVWCLALANPQPVLSPQINVDADVNIHLLQYWFERMCQIMALDPNSNPMSFPFLRYLSSSSSLVYIIQCMSAAHQEFFQPSRMALSLEQRTKALQSLRRELQSQSLPPPLGSLIVLMLGMSSSWITMEPTDYGKEHLLAAQTFVDLSLQHQATLDDDLIHLTVCFYVYWDMACSFCLDTEDHPPSSWPQLAAYVTTARNRFHTITAHSTDLYYLLGQLGRYCRLIADGFQRDVVREMWFESELNTYSSPENDQHACMLTEAFRNHGLIMLYRLCGRRPRRAVEAEVDKDYQGCAVCPIRALALRTLDLLFNTPLSSSYVNLHPIPLLSAGAELTAKDSDYRERVTAQLQAVYSTNRIPPTLWVIELLKELWEWRDSGLEITWLDLMLAKQWRLRIG